MSTPSTPPTGEPTCPYCGNALFTVTYGGGPLNRDQWESQKAGDYYCATCPGNDRSKTGLRYFWQSELAVVRSAGTPPAVVPGPEQAVRERNKEIVRQWRMMFSPAHPAYSVALEQLADLVGMGRWDGDVALAAAESALAAEREAAGRMRDLLDEICDEAVADGRISLELIGRAATALASPEPGR